MFKRTALAVAASLAAPAQADPASIAAISSFIVQNAATIAMVVSVASVGFSVYAAKKMGSMSSKQAERKQILRSSAAPVNWLYGENESAGLLVYAEEEAGDQRDEEKLVLVITHAGHPIEAVTSVRLNDDNVTTFGDNAVIEHHLDGRDTVDPYLKANCPSWQDDMLGKGLAWYRITLKYDSDLFPTGVPNIVCVKKGRKDIYDPRTGTTGYSDNNALCLLHYLKNHPSLMYEDKHLIIESFIDSANICDELVPVYAEDGVTVLKHEKRYRLGAEFEITDQPQKVINDMLASMGADPIRIGGRFGVQAAAYYGPSTLVLDESYIDRDETISLQPEASRDDTFNIVRGTYNSRDNNFQETDYPEVRFDSWIAEDQAEIPQNLNLPFVQSPSQAMRLATIEAYRARFGMTVELPLNWRGIIFTPGTTFALKLKYLGFTGEEFKVLEWKFDIRQGVTIVARRESPEFYRDEVARDIVLPPLVNLPTGGIPAPINAQFNAQAVGDIVQGIITWQNMSYQLAGTRLVITNQSTNQVVQTAYVPFPGTEAIFNGKVAGTYRVDIINVGILGGVTSKALTMTVVIEPPKVPDAVDAIASNWNVQLTPVYSVGKTPFGTLFEFFVATQTDFNFDRYPSETKQPDQIASSWNHGGLTPNTEYYYFIRAVNSYGKSNFTKIKVKTKRETDLVTTLVERLVGIEIFASYFASDQTANPAFYIDADGRRGTGIGAIKGAKFIGSELVSDNYVVGMTGWRLWPTGAEFNTGVTVDGATVRGRLTAAEIEANKIVGDITSMSYKYGASVTVGTINKVMYKELVAYTITTGRNWERGFKFPSLTLSAHAGRNALIEGIRVEYSCGGQTVVTKAYTHSNGDDPSEHRSFGQVFLPEMLIIVPPNWSGRCTIALKCSHVSGGASATVESAMPGNALPATLITKGGDLA